MLPKTGVIVFLRLLLQWNRLHGNQWNEGKTCLFSLRNYLTGFFFFQLYSSTINDLILRQQIILSAVYFFPQQLTLFLTYHSVSSLLRDLRLSTYQGNAGREHAGHVRSFLGEQRGVSCDAFGYCAPEGQSEPWAASAPWGGQWRLPRPHQPCSEWNSTCGQRGWLSRAPSAHWEGRKSFFSLWSFLLSASTAEDAQQPPISLLIHKRFVFMGNLLTERCLCM